MTDRVAALAEFIARGRYGIVIALASSLTEQDICDGLDRLLDYATRLSTIGRYDRAAQLITTILRAVDSTGGEAIRIRNYQAVLAGGVGRYAEALAMLEDTHIDAGRANSPLLSTIQANLAVLSLLAGDLAKAQKWVDIARDSEDPAATVVVTAVGTAIARTRSDRNALALSTSVQTSAVLDYLARAGDDNPLALAGVAGLLATEFELPASRRSPEHTDAVIDASEIAVQRTAAILGHDHPQAVVASVNLALAVFEVARDEDSVEAMRRAMEMVHNSTMRASRVFGYDHPQPVIAHSNLASAQFELARTERSAQAAAMAFGQMQLAAEQTARVLGADHPQSLVALSNYASAEFELAQINGSRDQVEHALESLTAASARSAAILGNQHPSTLLLRHEMWICEALIADNEPDEPGGGSLQTKLRTQTKSDTPAFGDEYISVDDAAAVLNDNAGVPDEPLSQRLGPVDGSTVNDHLVREGDIAGDYLARFLDLVDYDGNIDLDVDGDRAVVRIDGGDDLEKLIGSRGQVLEALENLTRLAVEQETGVRSNLSLDIADWRADRRIEIRELVMDRAKLALDTGKRVRLWPMTPFEREVVQDKLAELVGVDSEFEGKEPLRSVVIFPTT
jgi:spoIIIJ-associated protein